MPDGVVRVVQHQIPGVVAKTQVWQVDNARGELFSEVYDVVAELGLSHYDPKFTLEQYVGSLLFTSANRLTDRYVERRSTSVPGDVLQTRPARQAEPVEAGDDAAPVDGNGFTDPLQTTDQVLDVLVGMSDIMQRTAYRVWFANESAEEVAASEGKSVNAIHTRLHRIRRVLSAGLRIPLNRRGRKAGDGWAQAAVPATRARRGHRPRVPRQARP